jgi:hypothetical protein
MLHSNSSNTRRPLPLLIAVAASALAALWSAPAAHADSQYDGIFILLAGNRTMSAHWDLWGNGDPSRPSGTITDADGCTIETSLANPTLYSSLPNGGSHFFMRGRVTSGGGPNCLDTNRLSLLCHINPTNGETDVELHDVDHNDRGWDLKGSAGC